MLATTELWFRYQDAQVLKGLTLDFSQHARHRTGGSQRLWEIHPIYESERITATATGRGIVAGKPLDYSKRGLPGAASQVATVISGSRSANFLHRYRQRYRLQPAQSWRGGGRNCPTSRRGVDAGRCATFSPAADSVLKPRTKEAGGHRRCAGATGKIPVTG